MECPNCDYKTGTNWVNDELVEAEAKEGEFYKVSAVAQRERYGYDDEYKNVYACPSCKMVFVDW